MPADVVAAGSRADVGFLTLAEACEITDVDAAAREVVARASARGGGFACLCNTHVLTLALHDRALLGAVEQAWRRYPDGAAVAWLQRRAGHANARRVGGPDLMPRVVDLGREHGLRHFLLGSTPRVLDGVERVLRERFPGAQLVGRHSPPFADGVDVDDASVAAVLAVEAEPHVVWCALGAPKQELWMRRNAGRLPGVLLVGVGAAFDFLAGTKKRAPAWMQKAGLEWMHRLASEPRRLSGRYVRTNSEFLARSGLELTRRRLLS